MTSEVSEVKQNLVQIADIAQGKHNAKQEGAGATQGK